MPITNYSVLAGDPISGKVVTGRSGTHYQITMQGADGPFTVAVNIQSDDGSEVLYAIKENFTPPDPDALVALPLGTHPLDSQPGGLALDFVRSTVGGLPMVTLAEMTLLPIARSSGFSEEDRTMSRIRAGALENAIVTLLDMTIADMGGVIYAFGSAYADRGQVDGIHDIHMNQGNAAGDQKGKGGSHSGDNGVWQDGALFIHLPASDSWMAIFIAFQTQSWNTDSATGDPD